MSESRMTPEEREELARSLRQRLGARRFRPRRWFLGALALVALAAAGLRYASRAPAELPPVILVCFDALAFDPDAAVEAKLSAPGHPKAKLEGLDVAWEISGAGPVDAGTAKTDAAGVVRIKLGVRPPGEKRTARASFLDPEGEYRRDDRAAVVAPGDERIAVVAIEHVTPHAIDWLKGEGARTPAHAGTAKVLDRGSLTLYCCGAVDPGTYREMRLWLRERAARGELPPGLLLRERADELASRLSLRRPDGNVSQPLAAFVP